MEHWHKSDFFLEKCLMIGYHEKTTRNIKTKR